MQQPTDGPEQAGSTSHIGAIGRQISPKAAGPGSADCKLGSQAPIRGPASRIRRSLAIRDRPRGEGRIRKDAGKPIILVWFWFRSSLEGQAAKVKRTSEPPHRRARIGPNPQGI